MFTRSATLSTFPLSAPLQALFFALLFSRGVFELYLPKKYAMALHLLLALTLAFLLFGNVRLRFTQEDKPTLLVGLSFLLVTFISGFITLFVHDRTFWIAYNFFNLALVLLGMTVIRRFSPSSLFPAPEILFAGLGWYLLLPALAEHIQYTRFPGVSYLAQESMVRPASLTGSFLHYPIVIPLIGFALLNTGRHLFSALFFLLAPFAAFSRSGIFIVLAAFSLYPLFSRSKRGIIGGLIALLLLGAIPLLTQTFPEESYIGKIHQRVAHAASGSASGNSVRLEKWRNLLNEWLETNLLFGEDTGHYSNATHQFEQQYITYTQILNSPESSVLQLLSNYGLLGCLLFYLFLFQVFRFLHPLHLWLRAAFLAASLQTIFYQSIEVVPFILFLFLFPWISQSSENKKVIPI